MDSNKRSKAAIRIASEISAIDDICSLIHVRPTRFREKGVSYGKRLKRIAQESIWFFDSDLPESDPVETHIQQMVDVLRSNKIAIKQLAETCDISVSCFYSTRNGQGGICLRHELIAEIAAFQVDLVFDLYVE